MRSNEGQPSEYIPRSARSAAAEIARFSAFFAFLALVVPMLVGNRLGFDPVFAWLVQAGNVLYQQLPWALGIEVAALWSFYAVTISGRMSGGIHMAARTRRLLGTVAELLVAGITPVVLLIGVYCWANPAVWAVFIVLLPIVGLMWLFATQLGVFIVFDRETRIENATRRRARSEALLRRLTNRSRRTLWAVLLVNALIISGAAFLISFSAGSIELALTLGASYFVESLVLLGVNVLTLFTIRTSSDRLIIVMAWVIWATLYLFALLVTGVPFLVGVHAKSQVGIAFVVVMVAGVTTTLLPFAPYRRFVIDWTVRGVAARLAGRSVERTLVRANEELVELSASSNRQPAIWRQLWAATQRGHLVLRR